MNPYTVSAYLRVHSPDAAPEIPAWQDLALCAEVGDDFWFPEKGGSTLPAKQVCRSCEVRAECLEYALTHEEQFGVYGGLSERERRRLKVRFGNDVAAAVASAQPRFTGTAAA